MFDFTLEDGAAITTFKGVRGHLTQRDSNVICQLATEMEPGDIYVEVGSYLGCSACITAHYAPPGVLVYAHDMWVENMSELADASHPPIYVDNYFKVFYENVRRLKMERTIIPIRGDSKYTLTIHEPGSVSFAFVDGDHSFEGALTDMRNTWNIIKPGGVMLLHDCRPESEVFKSMTTFLDEQGMAGEFKLFEYSSIAMISKSKLSPL
tara:strand:- start:891 stop:1514 length:624 start_codon:yes stop_codon:yes gene_type:complete